MNKVVVSGTWCLGGLFHDGIGGRSEGDLADAAMGKYSLMGEEVKTVMFLYTFAVGNGGGVEASVSFSDGRGSSEGPGEDSAVDDKYSCKGMLDGFSSGKGKDEVISVFAEDRFESCRK